MWNLKNRNTFIAKEKITYNKVDIDFDGCRNCHIPLKSLVGKCSCTFRNSCLCNTAFFFIELPLVNRSCGVKLYQAGYINKNF